MTGALTRSLFLAGLLTLANSCNAGGDPYGPLFMSPAQRAQLDERLGNRDVDPVVPGTADAVTIPNTQPLTLSGTLISSTGKRDVWINGHRQAGGEGPAPQIHVLNNGNVEVKLSPSGTPHRMKPGQVLNRETGSVSEAYTRTSKPDQRAVTAP